MKLEFDLDEPLPLRGDDDGAPVTMRDLIVQDAGRRIRDQVVAENVGRETRALVVRITDEEIRAAVRPIISEALARPVTPRYGGSPQTLEEHITKIVRDGLSTERRGRSGGYESLLSALIREQVERVLGAELRKEVEAAKAEVRSVVRTKAADVLAETIERMAEGRRA